MIEIVTDAMLSGGPQPDRQPHARGNRRPLSRKAGAGRRADPARDRWRCCRTTSRCRRAAPTRRSTASPRCAARPGSISTNPSTQVRNHAAALQALSPEADVIFDASFSPRLDYYTGIVFEMTGADGEVLASGGEYDRMLERLGATTPVTASGCALWVDRLGEGGRANEHAAGRHHARRSPQGPPRGTDPQGVLGERG